MDSFNEKKWFYLAFSSLSVVTSYIILDFLNKKRYKKLQNQLKNEANSTVSSTSHIITQMPEPILNAFQKNQQKSENDGYKIHKICITGGPCAGKTTGLAYVAEKLRERDIAVFLVPEAATLIAQGGGMIKTADYTNDDAINFQTTLLLTQCHLEDLFMDLALLARQEAVILTDRGLMDGSAYMKPENWQTLLDEKGWNEVSLRDRRYDAVIHLVTAAEGAVEFYNLANAARYEKNLEDAIDVDHKIQNAWMGHPNFQIVDNKNTKNFEHKKNRLLSLISKIIGKPNTMKMRYKRKYLLDIKKNVNDAIPNNIKTKIFTIEDTYLKEENVDDVVRIRKSYSKGYYTYTYSSKMIGPLKEFVKTKRQISPREYFSFMQQKDVTRNTIQKERVCFIEKSYFIMDTYKIPNKTFSLLKIEVENMESQIEFPDFVKIRKEFTNNVNYTSHFLSKKEWLFPEADLNYFNIVES